MDIFAHSISGALIGRAVRPEGKGWREMVAYAALAGVSPDIDAPIALLGPEMWYKWHQIFTHSLVGLIWIPAVLSIIPCKFAAWRTRYAIALAGWFLHVLLDFFALWPVPLLWPLSSHRWNYPLISSDFSWIVDMLLLIGLAFTLWDPAQRHARWIAAITAIVVTIWLFAGLPT